MKRTIAGILSCFTALLLVPYSVNSKEIENASLTSEYKLLEKMPQNENFMFSPISIKHAFMLAANGAENETQKEILDFFGISDLNKSNSEFKETIESLTKSGIISIANSVWLNTDCTGKNIKFNDKYLENIKKYFDAKAKEVTNKNAVKIINDWVKDKTKGKIDSIIKDPEFLAVLVNAIHFKADWKRPFKKESTHKRAFMDKNGNETQTDFMQQKGNFNYFEDSELQLLEMKYKNTELSMYVALPKPGKEVTEKNLQKAMENKKSECVDIKLPKFKTETSLELSETMKKLGIQKAFNEYCPDFCNAMFKNVPKNLTAYISKVFHKSFIEVDEKGTEAAAATAIVMECTCCAFEREPICREFNANRPFKYLIKDNKSDEALFIGEQTFFN